MFYLYIYLHTRNFAKLSSFLFRGLLYKSSTDCLIQAVQGEGFMSLYKGFLPSWLRMVTSGFSFLCFCFLGKLLLIYKYFPLSLLVFSMALPPNTVLSLFFISLFVFFLPLLRVLLPSLLD